jgi:integrase
VLSSCSTLASSEEHPFKVDSEHTDKLRAAIGRIRKTLNVKPRQRCPEYAEFDAILSRIPEHHRRYFLVAARLGYRKNELNSLQWKHIKFGDRPSIKLDSSLCKNQRGVETPLYPELASIFEEMLSEAKQKYPGDSYLFRHVFEQQNGEPYSSETYRESLKKAQDELGLDHSNRYRFHDLRKTAAHYLQNELGLDLDTIADFYTNHKSIEILTKYYAFKNDNSRKVAFDKIYNKTQPGESNQIAELQKALAEQSKQTQEFQKMIIELMKKQAA